MSKQNPQSLTVQDEVTEFLLYTAPGGAVKVEVILNSETIWLSQKLMAELFDTSSDNISLHLKNIYADGELLEEATAENFSVVQTEGNREVKRNVKFYNLDAVISVGYRVNSSKATQFRIWATQLIKEYIVKGFAESVNKFLAFNEYQVLEGYGKVTGKQAEARVLAEYEKYNKQQKIESDFDKQIKALETKHKKQISSEGEGE